ncbi:MAG: TonB-dependent receptor [Bryobacteraceae bacterium]
MLLLSAAPAAAQVLYGSLTGDVKDASGGVVPAAQVAVKNRSTGVSYTANTTVDGLYRILNVQAGSYDLSVTASGFRTFTAEGVVVSVNTVTRIDAILQVGQVTEQVTVEASQAVLQTEKADTHSEIGARAVTQIPLPGYRNYQSLINLVPGATPARFQNSVLDTPARSLTTNINGTNRNNNVTRIDGAASINVWLPHHAGYVAPAETVDTVNITTGAGDAEQGLSGGASTTVVTKSGTNELHGSGFWFHDNQRLRANNFFASTKPVSNYNNFGATLGGPIRKNKLFYFFSYDKTTQRASGVLTNITVPTADQRRGDFSAYPNVIYDPFTGNADGTARQPFSGNVIPSARLDPIALAVQDYYPLPNRAGTASNYFAQGSPPFARRNIDFKVNYNPTERYAIWGKYGNMDAPVSGQPIFGEAGGPAAGGSPGNAATLVNLATMGHTYTISPTLLYDGVIGFWRQDQTVTTTDFGKDFNLGIPGVGGPDPRQKGFPNINPGYTGFGSPGWQPLERIEENWTTSQNFTWIKSAHQIRFGFDGILLKLSHWQPELGGGPRGVINFAGDVTALRGGAAPNQFNTYAAFLLGQTSSMQKALQHILATGREWQFAGYFTDRWRATQNLTINVGLRYEYFPLMTRAGGKGLERYDPDTNLMYLGGRGPVPQNAGITVSKALFSPRIGLAYRLGERTVIRTGYGLNFDPMPFSRPLRGQYPLTVTFDFQRDGSFQLFRTLAQGIPPVVGPDLSPGILEVPLTAALRSPYAGKLDRGYIQSWNFTVEHKLPGDFITSVGYVGTSSIGMLGDRDVNATISGGNAGRPYASITGRRIGTAMWDSYLNANYHSLQIAMNRAVSRGLMLKGAYTFSKAINMTDDDGWAGVTWNSPEVFDRNRARAGYDQTHIFQMGFVYDLPVGKGQKFDLGTVANYAIGGWQVSGIAAMFTGRPFGVGASGASLNAAGNGQTADQVGAVTRLGGYGPGQPYYNPSAFAPVTAARFGTSGRNILDAPGVRNLDLSLAKSFQITEKVNSQFRAEFFNFTNTPQFGTPSTSVTSTNFMQVTSASGERQIRFGLRFSF